VSSRGFTLVELLVGIAVSSIILVAVAGAFIAGQRALQAQSQIRGAVEQTRGASAYVDRIVRLAGYGVDPRFAFDFSTTGLPGTTKDNFTSASPTFITDDLAFRFRDPGFLRRGSLGSTGETLTLTTPLTAALTAEQPVLVACPGGVDSFIGRAASGSTTSAINLTAYGAPFPTAIPSCLRDATGGRAAYVMLIREVRLRIIDIAGTPYLVLYKNLDAPTSTNTAFEPLAADVESFQVAYVMNRPPSTGCCSADTLGSADGNGTFILGDAPGETLPVAQVNRPGYSTPYDDALRYTADPANIRQVRISLLLRSVRKEQSDRTAFAQQQMENYTPSGAAALPDGFYRTWTTSTVRVPNLASRSFFLPPMKSGPLDPTDLNVWGG
jgi:type IV pilus assembly protein PilW